MIKEGQRKHSQKLYGVSVVIRGRYLAFFFPEYGFWHPFHQNPIEDNFQAGFWRWRSVEPSALYAFFFKGNK